MSVPLLPAAVATAAAAAAAAAAAQQHAMAPVPPRVRTNPESETAPLGISASASTMIIFGDREEGTAFGLDGDAASADDGQQQQLPGGAEGGLAGQMRSNIKERAMRLEDLKLARQNACCDERGDAFGGVEQGPADEVIVILWSCTVSGIGCGLVWRRVCFKSRCVAGVGAVGSL